MPDHAGRAVACAIAMQAKQAWLNEEAESDGHQPLEMGIGVNTGTVVAGAVGGGGRLEYTVVGDAVNVASRLQSQAEGGEILVSAATLAAAPGFDTEAMGEIQVKGRTALVETFRIRV